MLWLLASIALAGTVTLEADESVVLTVGAASAQGDTAELTGYTAGAFGVQVQSQGQVVWAGQLQLPSDDVDVHLKWKKQKLVIDKVKVKRSGMEKAMRAAKVAGNVAAAGQQASAMVGDAQAAGSDLDKAQRGELTESSHTSMSMDIGPDGVSSSSSRTTAGADGVRSSSTSSHVGRNGPSLSTSESSLSGSGYTERSDDKSLRLPAGDRGEVVLLGGPVAPGEVLAAQAQPEAVAAVVAPPPKVELPGEVVFVEPEAITRDQVMVRFYNPVATVDSAKLAISFENTGSDPISFTLAGARMGFAGATLSPEGRKAERLVAVSGGDKTRKTFAVDGDLGTDEGFRTERMLLSLSGVSVHSAQGPAGVSDLALAVETTKEAVISCAVGKYKLKKGQLNATWKCSSTSEQPVIVDMQALTVSQGELSSGGAGEGLVLVVPEESTKISATWALEGDLAKQAPEGLMVSWSQAVLSVSSRELDAFEVQMDRIDRD